MGKSQLGTSGASPPPPATLPKENERIVTKEDLLLLKAELRDSIITREDLETAKEELRSEIKQSNAGHFVFWGTTFIVAHRHLLPRLLDWLNGL